MKSGTILCPLDTVPPGTARGISLPGDAVDRPLDIIVWHHATGPKAFKNSCPHLGMPLETFPDRFLTADGASLICSTHGAMFDAAGVCFSGPCKNQGLPPLPIKIEDGNIILA